MGNRTEIRDCGATAIDVSRRSRLAVVEDHGSPPGEDKVSDIINQTKAFSLIEQRITMTTDPRHLHMLERLLQHATGEAKPDLDLVMSTLSANPRYIAWGAPADLSPVGREAVRAVYEDTIVKGATHARQCRPNRRQSS